MPQSSPSRPTTEPLGTDALVPTDSVSAARGISWTPSISALPEPETRRTPNSLSQSKRLPRIRDEYSGHAGTLSASLPRTRRPSFEPPTSEVSRRSHKIRLETEGSDDVLPNALDSPEEGKGFRSSWEINVKKLVGDAVGNVNPIYYSERSRSRSLIKYNLFR